MSIAHSGGLSQKQGGGMGARPQINTWRKMQREQVMSTRDRGTISFPTAMCSVVCQRLTSKCTSIAEAIKQIIKQWGCFLLLVLNLGFIILGKPSAINPYPHNDSLRI